MGQAMPWLRRGVSVLATTAMLVGCAPGGLTTQSQRLGPDDGTDSCRPQLVALDSTGDYFGASILTGVAIGALGGGLAGGLISGDWKGALIGAAAGGAIGGATGYYAALQQQYHDEASLNAQMLSDLGRENAQIDRTTAAFDQLTACRYRQADAIRADYLAHRIDRATAVAAMNVVRQRAQRDLAVAQQINTQIAGRADQFVVAADKVAPGTSAAVASAAPPPRKATVRRAVPLKLSPDATAPEVASLKAREPVTVTRPADASGYALVETASGDRGYAPVETLQGAGVTVRTASTGSGDVETLAGSNAARRDGFAERVSVSQAAAAKGFELAG